MVLLSKLDGMNSTKAARFRDLEVSKPRFMVFRGTHRGQPSEGQPGVMPRLSLEFQTLARESQVWGCLSFYKKDGYLVL